MSVYDKSLEQIQSSYQFTDLEMAKMDYTLKVFAYELSKLVFFFVFFIICSLLGCFIAVSLDFRRYSSETLLELFYFQFLFFCCYFVHG